MFQIYCTHERKIIGHLKCIIYIFCLGIEETCNSNYLDNTQTEQQKEIGK
jgi:hypothetical protein